MKIISFGSYRSILKTYYKQGMFPEVKIGIYGEKLTKDNVSIDHLIPKSKNGPNILGNYALASRTKNELRGNDDLNKHITPQNAIRYIAQFLDIKLKNFDGNEYIKMLIETLKQLKVF